MDDTGLGGSQLNLGANQAIASLSNPTAATASKVNLNGNQLTIGNGTTPANAAAATTFNGVVSGAGGSLVKDGTSTQIFTNTNTYTAGTVINNGILNFTTSTGATPFITVNGSTAGPSGTLQLGQAGGGTVTTAANLFLNGPGFNPGAGALGAVNVLGGAATTVNVNGFIVANTDTTISAAGSTLNINGGLFKTGVNVTLGSNTSAAQAAGTININGPGNGGFGIQGNSGAFNSDLIVDSTTVNENIANNYVGNTFIRSSVASSILNANVANALPNSSNANRNLRTVVVMGDATSTTAGALTTTLNINSNGNAAQALISPPPVAVAGNPNAANAAGAAAIVNLGGNTFTIGNDVAGSVLVATGSTTGLQESFYGTINGTAAAILIKDGVSTQIIAGPAGSANTFLGTVDVSAGTLQIGDGVTAGTGNWIAAVHNLFVDPAGTLNVDLINGETFKPNVLDNGTVVSIITAGNTQTLGGQITGNGTVVANGGGTTILSNINGYQGGTTVTNGSTLQVGNAASGGTAGTGAITLGGPAAQVGTLDVFNVAGGTLANSITSGGTSGTSTVQDTGSTSTITLTGAITNGAGGGLLQVFANAAGGTLVLANAGNTYGAAGVASTQAFAGGTLQIGTTAQAGSVGIATSIIDADTGGTVVLVNINTNTLANTVDNLFGGTGTFAINSANTNTITGAILSTVGTINLVQSGTGTTILTATDSYTGSTTVSGGTLQVGNGATGNLTGTTGVTVTNNGILAIDLVNGGTFAPTVVLNGANTALNAIEAAGNTNTLSGVVSGTGSLNQNGANAASTTIITAADTYTGATNVNVGVLQIGSAATAGNLLGTSGVTVANGAALTITNLTGSTFTPGINLNGATAALNTNGGAATTFTLSGPITGTGVLNQTGAGTTILTGANSYTGTTTISAGTLQIGAGGTTGTLGTGNVVDNTALVFNRTDTVTVGNLISGTGTVTQAGTGTTILTNTDTYTGATAVTAGTLQVGNGTTGNLTGTSGVAVSNGAILAIDLANGGTFAPAVALNGATAALNAIEAGTNTLSGVISGTGILNQTGPGTTILTNTNTYTGITTISAGTLQIGAGTAAGTLGTGNVVDNGILAFNRPDTITVANVISGTGIVDQNGTGTTVLTATDTYTGATNVNAGTLQVGNGATGNLTGNGGVNVANGAILATDLVTGGTFSPNVSLNGPTAALNAIQTGTNTLSGSIGGTGVLNQNGTGTTILTGANTYSGTTTITAGILQIGSGGTAGTLGTGNVVDNATLNFNRSDAITVANVISGTGAVNQNGTGSTTLTGTNTYSGLTTVNAGELRVGNNNALGVNPAGTTVVAGATLRLLNGINVATEALTLNGAGTGGAGALAGVTGGTETWGGTITLASSSTINANGSTLNLNGGITKTGFVLTLTSSVPGGLINVNGVISGATATFNSDLVVNGTTVNLNNANTYFGPTAITSLNTVGDGVLNANVANALPTANGRTSITMDATGLGGSTLNIGGSVGFLAGASQSIASLAGAASSKVTLGANTLTIGFGTGIDTGGTANANFAGVISGTGGITKNETSLQIFSGLNTYTGATTVTGGTLQAGSIQAFGVNSATTVNTPGILDLAGNSNTLGSLAGTGTVTNSAVAAAPATLTVGTLNTNTTFSGLIADANIPNALSLTKVGTGTLTLTGANTYNGVTNVNAGILNIQNASALGTVNGGTTVANGATLQIQGGITTLAEALTLNGAGAAGQTGALVNSGGVNVFTGPITLGSASTISSDAGTLTLNNAAPIVGNGNALTLAGASNGFVASVINNTVASVTKNGAGTWQLGAGGALNTYTGLTTINGGTLQAGSVQAFGNKSIVTLTAPLTKLDLNGFSNTIGALSGVPGSLVDNTGAVPATLTTGQAASSIFAGTIENTGSALSLIKVGASKFTLTGQNTYTGNTFVNGGILQVDGSTTSPNTYVAFGAQLQGTGLIGGNLINGGTVKPGDSPGTLSVKNNYTQLASGNLRIELASTTSYGRLQVGGKASLNGTLTAVSDGGFTPKPGNTFTILTAAGGVTGKFNTFINQTGAVQSTLLKFEIEYDPKDVKLEYVQSGFVQSFANGANGFSGLTPNQMAVASELDHVIFDKRMAGIISYLDNLPLSAIPGALDQIAPEELASIYNTGVALANVQTSNLQRRTADLRAGSSGFSASGFHMAGSGPDYSGSMSLGGAAGPSGPDGKEVKETKQVMPEEPKFGVFLTGIGEWVNVGSDFNSRGYDLDSGGFTLGLDYKLTPTLAVGLNAGYAHTNGDLNNGGRLDVDGGTVGLYATYFPSDFYIDTAVTGGYNSYSTKRAGLAGSTFGETDGGSLNVLFGTGYMVHAGGLTVGPTGTFQYTYMGVNEFTEHGSLAPLNIPGQNQESIRTAFGAKASYDWKAGGVVIRPELSLAWQHEYADAAYEIDGRFANGAGGVFAVHGPSVGRDSLLLGAGVAVQWSERLSTYVYYDGEFGRTNYQDSNVSGGFRVSF